MFQDSLEACKNKYKQLAKKEVKVTLDTNNYLPADM